MAVLALGNRYPSEIDEPPPSLAPPPDDPWAVAGVLSRDRIPPLYVYTQRREPREGPGYVTGPDSQYNKLSDLNIGWHEAPDPIRQSPYYSAGNKIHPEAQMPIPSMLAIGAKEAVMEDTYHVGKLLGYWHRPMYAGKQKPSIQRANIEEAIPTTYGSLYEVRNMPPQGPFVAEGFVFPTSESNDGYPY